MIVKSGLDVLREENFKSLNGLNIGVVCHQASIDQNYRHILDYLIPLHQDKQFTIKAVFGPQHGLYGHTQDNMIEWEGTGQTIAQMPVYSLYGENRKPTVEMLQGIDVLLIDLQDVGARYYTFIWTMALCMEACAELGIKVLVLDRPNPINGIDTEGTINKPEYKSFVGLYPLQMRHGKTIGEIARYLAETYIQNCELDVVEMTGWQREMFWPDTGLPWALPSPNMPTFDTALVYPGQCLLEGTNISEGRGTTRPFEIFGAPWINAENMTDHLNELNLPGVYFRPVQFEPTFQKHAGKICRGAFIHVTDPKIFKPVQTTLSLLKFIVNEYPKDFKWKQPPYEYEYEKLPFDILAGNSWVRERLECGENETIMNLLAK